MSDKKYLVVKGNAGLGNRMLCAVTGMLYSRLMGRQLIIDWTDEGYSSDRTNSFAKLFHCGDVEPGVDIPVTDSVTPDVWRGYLHMSAGEMIRDFDPDKFSSSTIHRKYSADLAKLEYPEDVVVMWAFSHQIPRLRQHFRGRWSWLAGMSDEAILRWLLRDELLAQPHILERVEAFAAANFSDAVIGVHVRFTDRVGSLDAHLARVDQVLEREPNAKVFLATDNLDVVDRFTERFGEPIQTQKWFPPPGVIMHQNPDCPDRLQNAIEALVDMHLLARCDHLVHARSSTFSYIASLLSEMPRTNVHDVEQFSVAARARRLVRQWLT